MRGSLPSLPKIHRFPGVRSKGRLGQTLLAGRSLALEERIRCSAAKAVLETQAKLFRSPSRATSAATFAAVPLLQSATRSIGGIERGAFQLALTLQHAPAIGDGVRKGQDAVTKPDQQIGMKPSFQLGTAAALGKHHESFADFTNRDSAQIECGWGLCFQPRGDARFGPVPAEF